ncbi:low affinity immunoglobulin gamma Fc region receptor III-like [Girardinichthys multiradiatus]|uniref:low affinity immunoglobulin gamma Fc region receptor III-like n=1 Tax=Girardinichthys multiradiatus TaxID=208333 RepID=UPI001FABACEA|nr:low affinity immunoglobulin gamma Fc region receptor III-like [Girardinichthys multiradiatus]
MEVTVLCAVVACLRLLPSRSQFFQYENVVLSCEGNSTEWRVRRKTSKKIYELCPSYPSKRNDSTCVLNDLYEQDSGVYWCESEAGERSNEVNITVTDGELILESPEHPVSEGENLTFHCRARTSFSNQTHFYKNEELIGSSSTGNFTIQSVSKSDEGLYKCNVSGLGESEERWLTVRGCSPQTPTASLAHIVLPVVVCILSKLGAIFPCNPCNNY